MKCCSIFYLVFFIFSHCTFASTVNSPSSEQNHEELEVVIALSIPPFIMESTQNGLEIDIIREAFASVGYKVLFTHMPLGSTLMGLKRLKADAVATFLPNEEFPEIVASDPYIHYKNVAVSLAKNAYSIKSIEHLKDKRVAAFQNARLYLGNTYVNSVANASYYREVAQQQKQIALLFSGKVDVIVLDISIFRYAVQNNKRYDKAYKIHHILGKAEYSLGFESIETRDLFNEGLKRIKAKGIYQSIWKKYIK